MLNTGMANYDVRLALPPGVNGQTPSLTLRYNGGTGHSVAGIGWTLGPGAIERQTEKGIPRYVDGANDFDDDYDGEIDELDELDRFVSPDNEELVPLGDGTYRTRIERSFSLFERVDDHDHWLVHARNGTKLEYGLTADARVTDAGGTRVFRWLLERSTDTNDNEIEYLYSSFGGSENQKYLQEVRYGPGPAPWSAYYFARLTYEDRSDWRKDYRSGFLIRTAKRLAKVEIGVEGIAPPDLTPGDWNDNGTADHLIRRYVLEYEEVSGYQSFLTSIKQFGADGLNYLPPISFTYSTFSPAPLISADGAVEATINEPPSVMDDSMIELIDLNHDALPDILETGVGGVHTVYVNSGRLGGPGSSLEWGDGQSVLGDDAFATQVSLANPGVHLADMTGDGVADLVQDDGFGGLYQYRNRGDLSWGPREAISVGMNTPPAPFADSTAESMDADFDKRIDVVRSTESGYFTWFNLGDAEYSERVATTGAVHQGQNLLFSDPKVRLADINGDRLSDVVKVTATQVIYCANLGHGEFAASVVISIPDWVLDGNQTGRAQLKDIDGDGLSDLVVERAVSGELWYWRNLGTDTLSLRHVVEDMPASFNVSMVTRWADINGNGTTDLIYADTAASPRLRFLDLGALLASAHPNLLVEIDNGLGATTKIRYKSSSEFYVGSDPPWSSTLPFPVTVVASVETSSGLDLDTVPGKDDFFRDFQYRDGYYDPNEKGFRGFAETHVVDNGDSTFPTLYAVHQFHTGGPDGVDNDGDGDFDEVSSGGYREEDALKGVALGLERRGDGDFVFGSESNRWEIATLLIGADSLEVRFAENQETLTQIDEGTGSPETLRVTRTYDEFGNVLEERNYGALSIAGDEAFRFNDFINDTDRWILGKPERELLTDEAETKISESFFYYDGEDYEGLPLGSLTKANPTREERWIEEGESLNQTRNAFDAFGNVVGTKDGEGNLRQLKYDEELSIFPVEERIVVGDGKPDLVMIAAYNRGLAVVTSSDDFNENRTEYEYDTFGRLVAIVKPGDSSAFPTQRFVYTMADPENGLLYEYDAEGGLTLSAVSDAVSSVKNRSREEVGSPGTFDTVQYSDGLGRSLARVEEAEQDFVVTGAQLFNERETPRLTFQPYRSTSMEYAPPPVANDRYELHYDAIGREIQKINPLDSEGQSSEVSTEYLPLERQVTDENGNVKTYFNDGLDRLSEVHELNRGEIYVTTYEYNAADSLTRIRDAQDNVKTMVYDGLQRRVSFNDPDRGIMSYMYDDASNVRETVDAKGQRITYTYDGANRMLTEDYHDEGLPFSANRSPDVVYHYDQPAGVIDLGDGTQESATNTAGMLAWISDLSGEEHTSFDERGRVKWTVKRIPDPGNGVLRSYRTGMSYDSLDRLRQVTYPDNDRVLYSYNARSLVERIGEMETGDFITNIDYRASGQLEICEYGNGVTTTYGYDPRLRKTALTTGRTAQPAYLDYRYRFDLASNILDIDDLRPVATAPAGDPQRNSQAFAYDDLYRLESVQYSFSAPGAPPADNGSIHYTYDRVGNMLSKTSDIPHVEDGFSVTHLGAMSYGGPGGRFGRVGRQPGDPPGPHALTATGDGRSYAYDDNGNMTGLGAMALTWDFKDRLVGVDNNGVLATYTYDFSDRRIVKKVTTSPGDTRTTQYVDRYFEVREFAQPVKYVFNGSTRVARITGNADPLAPRVQRLSVWPGWNLISLSVGATDAGAQLGLGSDPSIADLLLLDPATGQFRPLEPTEDLQAGSVLWLRAIAQASLQVQGVYPEPDAVAIPMGGAFVAVPGLESAQLGQLPPEVVRAWAFDAASQAWRVLFQGDLAFLNDMPPALPPGSAIYTEASAPAAWASSPVEARVRYYHQDHLGSSNLVADGEGQLVEDVAFYPFGGVRGAQREAGASSSRYLFTQKETDSESRLQYFEARYLLGSQARMASVDPIAKDSLTPSFEDPQRFNTYSYSGNNPVNWSDPSGEAWSPAIDRGTSEVTDADEAAALTVGSMIPFVGEALDLAVIFGSDSTMVERGLATASLLANIFTGGGLPNFGGAVKAASKAADDVPELPVGIFPMPKAGDRVFRVYGGDSGKLGHSWTTIDPRSVDNIREAAGLPSGGKYGTNSAENIVEGTLADPSLIDDLRSALPLDGNKGGLPEILIKGGEVPNAIRIDE